jgi:hypothetical protein
LLFCLRANAANAPKEQPVGVPDDVVIGFQE